MLESTPTPQSTGPSRRRLDVGRGARVLAGADRVLGVVEHPHVDPDVAERVHEGGDRAVAGARDGDLLDALELNA